MNDIYIPATQAAAANTEANLIVAIIVLAALTIALSIYVIVTLKEIITRQVETIELLTMGPEDDDDDDFDPETRPLIPSAPKQVQPIHPNRSN